MKEKLIMALNNEDLPEHEIQYIVSVVKYIDDGMESLENQKISFASANNKMFEMVQLINNCNTGVEIIDKIVDLRKKIAYNRIGYLGEKAIEHIESNDYTTSSFQFQYVQKYIVVLSNFGGLYKIACDVYKNEFEKGNDSHKVMK